MIAYALKRPDGGYDVYLGDAVGDYLGHTATLLGVRMILASEPAWNGKIAHSRKAA